MKYWSIQSETDTHCWCEPYKNKKKSEKIPKALTQVVIRVSSVLIR